MSKRGDLAFTAVPLLAGAAVLAAAYRALPNPLIAFGMGAGVYLAMSLVISLFRSDEMRARLALLRHNKPLEQVMPNIDAAIERFSGSQNASLQELAGSLRSVRTALLRDPSSARRVLSFSTVHLPTMLRIEKSVSDLRTSGSEFGEREAERIEEGYAMMAEAGRRVEQGMLGQEILNVDSEMSALNTQMKRIV